jgi:hypothetical protein
MDSEDININGDGLIVMDDVSDDSGDVNNGDRFDGADQGVEERLRVL